MTTNELNTQLDNHVQSLITNGGLPDNELNRAYLLGVVQTEWLVEQGWERNQPGFWDNGKFPNHNIVTDDSTIKVFVYKGEFPGMEPCFINELPN